MTGPPTTKKGSTAPAASTSESQSKGQKRKADQLKEKNSKSPDVAKFKSIRACNNGVSSPLSFTNENSNDSFKSSSSTNSKTSKHSLQNNVKVDQPDEDGETEDTTPSDTGASKETNSEFLNWQHYTGDDSGMYKICIINKFVYKSNSK